MALLGPLLAGKGHFSGQMGHREGKAGPPGANSRGRRTLPGREPWKGAGKRNGPPRAMRGRPEKCGATLGNAGATLSNVGPPRALWGRLDAFLGPQKFFSLKNHQSGPLKKWGHPK